TGGARSGSIKSPLFSGGARAFGPHPRVYNFKLNKKVKQLARKSALSYKVKDSQILILEDFTFEEVKTKRFKELLSTLNISEKKSLFVLPEVDSNVYLSSRNIQRTKVLTAASINTYEILNANSLIVMEGAIQKINEMFKNN
ncbi:MAG: 50S ribosomal protein L4, partial [Bacteroidota bacterium]